MLYEQQRHMNGSKWVALSTGILAVMLGIGYLILVQILDYRGTFEPAPFS